MDQCQPKGIFTRFGCSLSLLACAWLTLSAMGEARAADPAGIWLTADGKARVRVGDCGGTSCGTIVWLKEPNDPATGRPMTDGGNPDATKRNRPIIGLPIVFDMRPSSTVNKWSGQVYDPREGKTYNGNMVLEAPSRLKIEGCVLFICESEIWTRVNEPVATQPPAAPPRPRS
jgi:uncharacterized protein (DUF2147 family)